LLLFTGPEFECDDTGRYVRCKDGGCVIGAIVVHQEKVLKADKEVILDPLREIGGFLLHDRHHGEIEGVE
jgi:hypothetical protein